MKKIYLKPTTEELLIKSAPLMITASVEGEKIINDGGTTENSGIEEADSRHHRDIWEDEEADDMEW